MRPPASFYPHRGALDREDAGLQSSRSDLASHRSITPELALPAASRPGEPFY